MPCCRDGPGGASGLTLVSPRHEIAPCDAANGLGCAPTVRRRSGQVQLLVAAFFRPRGRAMLASAPRLGRTRWKSGRSPSATPSHGAMQIVISPSPPKSENFLLEITPEDTTETIRSAVATHLGERSGRVRLVFGEVESVRKPRAARPHANPGADANAAVLLVERAVVGTPLPPSNARWLAAAAGFPQVPQKVSSSPTVPRRLAAC